MSTSSLPSFIKIHPAVLEKKSKMWKVYGRTDGRTDGRRRRTDDGRCAMTIAHSSLRLGWAKNKSSNIFFLAYFVQFLNLLFIAFSSRHFLYARLQTGRIMVWWCPSVRPSVRLSVHPFSALFSYMLWHIELKFCAWLCFTVLQIKFECRHFASIFEGVMPLCELRI